MPKPLPEALKAPITNIDEAYAWIRGLAAADMMFHFDDSPDSIIMGRSDERLFSDADARVISARLNEVYNLYPWGQHLCPIGIALMHDGADGYTLYDMPEYRLRGAPTPSLAIVCYEQDGVLIADRYCTPEADPGERFEVSRDGKVLAVRHLFEDALSLAQKEAVNG